MTVVAFRSLPILDDSEATLKSEGIEDLKAAMAVLSESIGIELPGGAFKTLVKAGTVIPMQYAQVVEAVGQGQNEIEIAFFRGTGPRVSDNSLIGKVSIKGFPPVKGGPARVELRLQVQRNGDLLLSPRDLSTGDALELRQAGR